MMNFSGKYGKNYGWELELFYKYRDLSDGLDVFRFDITLDRYPGDHNPQFNFGLKLFNFIIFEYDIYNVWHMDHPHSPFYKIYKNDDVTDCCNDDGPNYEIEPTVMMTPSKVTVVSHSRQKFYGKPIYWYEFVTQEEGIGLTNLLPQKFLKVPFTIFYEYGGTHEEAIAELTREGFTDIVEGSEI